VPGSSGAGVGGQQPAGGAGPFGAAAPKPGPPAAPAEAVDVEAITAQLDALDELPVSEHVAVFEAVHRSLQDTLAAVDGS
jgi:hypothetical protein